MDSIIELNDEQLDTVSGGDQSNSNGTVNLSGLSNFTPVIGSAVGFSNVGNAGVNQSSYTDQSNKSKSGGYWW